MGSTCAGLFLLAAATLMVEVLLTRIFDVILWPNLSFMIISSAMFGMGLGGLVETLRPSSARPRQDPSRRTRPTRSSRTCSRKTRSFHAARS